MADNKPFVLPVSVGLVIVSTSFPYNVSTESIFSVSKLTIKLWPLSCTMPALTCFSQYLTGTARRHMARLVRLGPFGGANERVWISHQRNWETQALNRGSVSLKFAG
jgi:hypothetical protein